MNRDHTCGELRVTDVNKRVKLAGWVSKKRNLGSLVFIDLRDRYGIIQLTFDESHAELCKDIRNEYVIEIEGIVKKKDVSNEKLATGDIEVYVDKCTILSESKTTPLLIQDDTDALEDIRLKYRYLDIRRNPIKDKLLIRDKVTTIIRRVLHELDFIEVETPILSKSTPEGARDYLVPSRLYNGEFYALPQSPQIYKQLLMIGGIDRYFQIARCFRDEDLRADRQPEFTQLDLEMSFANEEDLFKIIEHLMSEVFKDIKGITNLSFPRIKYNDALEYYGCDKPDVRFENKLVNLTGIFDKSGFKVFEDVIDNGGVCKGIIFNSLDISRKKIDEYTELVKSLGAKALAYLKKDNDVFSGSLNNALNDNIKNKLNLQNGDIIFIIADKVKVVNSALSALRLRIANQFNLIDNSKYSFIWVTDFPMFEYSEEENRYVSAHHPFTAPRDEDIDKLTSDPEHCYSRAYDLVINGYELLSGSVRIFKSEMQKKVFDALGLTPDKAKKRFGFFLEAFDYGTPPHLGIGLGLERLIMVLTNTDNIKDVVAFPKTASASCLMADAPSSVDEDQLKYLGINILKK